LYLMPSLVGVSFLVGPACAATRPRYGGTLRLETSGAVADLNPGSDPSAITEDISTLAFERLIQLDDRARSQPQLALSWKHDAEFKRWEFALRAAVKLHDGSEFTSATVAAALSAGNPDWRVQASAENTVVIETHTPSPHLLAELGLSRNSIWVRGHDGIPLGTGPFRIAQWQAKASAVLAANDDYWGGRPFLDRVEISMGRPLHAQLLDFELGKAEAVEVSLDQARRAGREGKVVFSAACEVLALQFAGSSGLPESDQRAVRQAIALSIDRSAMQAVLLQKQGEPAGGLLPQWLSGYSFLFAAATDLGRARGLRSEIRYVPADRRSQQPARAPRPLKPLPLVYDPADPLAELLAERIALNARDIGITLLPAGLSPGSANSNSTGSPSINPGGAAYARLVRVRLESLDPATALAHLVDRLITLDAQPPVRGWTDGLTISFHRARTLISDCIASECRYNTERAALADFWVIPLFHLPLAFGLNPKVRNWVEPREGGWPLQDVWMEAEPSRSESSGR
jgi:peptide/nickel transport system substrate-binding protein